jgi:transcriptional regulator with XRE-family HTH domain
MQSTQTHQHVSVIMVEKPSHVRQVLAGNLRRRRTAAGLSQEALADAAGLHRTFVGSVERCERNISLDNIAKLAAALGTSEAELLMEFK